ncbi:MAG: hypothetical protein KGZ63_13895 [Clostridiales bacterium]|jgi:hypothetical protein|nr:hypothetical protein [Clostridiales bacterium]
MKRYLALILLGTIFGAVLMNIYLSRRMDELYISREKLKVNLYETEERLKKMEAQWQSHRTALIKEVSIQFHRPLDDQFLELALRQQILKLTQNLVGEEVETIPYPLVVHLLDQRIVEADGKHFRLTVKTVIIAEKLTYVLDHVPQMGQNDDEP